MKFAYKNNPGFTLVELLLYVAISSIILLLASLFMSTLLESQVKNQTIAEVNQQGIQVMQTITQTLRNSSIINTPTIGISGATLSVNTNLSSTTPSVFDLSGGVIRIKEGSGATISLTNSKVIASNLVFSNLSRTGTPGIVRISFNLSAVNNSNRNEYSFSKNFVDSASLR
jgi:prepilin-type N-terminal cleavage/methylation domain-containing protein